MQMMHAAIVILVDIVHESIFEKASRRSVADNEDNDNESTDAYDV